MNIRRFSGWGRGRQGRERGLTLIEILVSIVILGVGIPILIGAMIFCYGTLKVNAHEMTALTLARKKIENLMNRKYNDLSTSSGAYSQADVALDSAGKLKAQVDVTVAAAGTNKKSITVVVRWIEQRRNLRVTLRSLASNHNITS